MSYSIKATQRFKKELKQLAKKYKKIKIDYENLLNELEKNPTLGTPLGNDCYKIRIPNSSIPTGKSGGFRIITLVKIKNDKIADLDFVVRVSSNVENIVAYGWKTYRENNNLIEEDELYLLLEDILNEIKEGE